MSPLKSYSFYELLLSIAVVLPLILLLAGWIKGRFFKEED